MALAEDFGFSVSLSIVSPVPDATRVVPISFSERRNNFSETRSTDEPKLNFDRKRYPIQ